MRFIKLHSVLFGLALVAFCGAADYPVDKVRADYRKLLDRPKVPLAPQMTAVPDVEFVIETGSFASEATERVPFLLVKSKTATGRLPAVIALHGTGGNKEGQSALLKELARHGFIGFAIDGRYHGARVPGGAQGSTQYQEAITRAWRERDRQKMEHPFYYDTCWDLWRTVDYLQWRPDVDGANLGVIGFSKGGIETWLGAAVDPRLKCAVPAIGVQSFRWSLENEQWQGRAKSIAASHEAARADLGEKEVNQRVCRELWSKVIPGILDEFDCPSMLRLFAPRPLLILNGEKDPNCPLGGAKLAFAQAEAAYQNNPDRLKIMVAEGVGHSVTADQRKAAMEWFEKWLKK